MTDPRIVELTEALHEASPGYIDISDDMVNGDEYAMLAVAILAALPPDWCGLPGFVAVRLYSGGVLADGTTNTEPIDFLNPPPPTSTNDQVEIARLRAALERLVVAANPALAWMAEKCVPDGAEYAAEGHLFSISIGELNEGEAIRDALRAALAAVDPEAPR
jgi:hypothetical protein